GHSMSRRRRYRGLRQPDSTPFNPLLLYRKPLSAITNRLKLRNERVVRFDRLLNQIIRRLTNADGLHQLATDVLHGSSLFEIDRLCAFIWSNVEDTSFA